jgi:hypothetical protein
MGIAGNKKLIIEFGEPEQPELIELRITTLAGEMTGRLRRSDSSGINFSWSKFPRAVSAYLLACKIHSQTRSGPFSLTANGKDNPLATIANGLEKSNPVLEFLQDKAGISFYGPNHDGSNKNIERRLNIRGLEAGNLEVVWARKSVNPATQLPKMQELLGKILQQEGGWLESWLAVTELAGLIGKATAFSVEKPDETHPANAQANPEDRIMDSRLRKVVISDCQWIRLVGIRDAANANRLPLDISFIHLSFQPIHQKKEPNQKPLTLVDVLNRSRLTVIVGGPGSGKTTLTRMAALQIAQGKLAGQVENLRADHVPVLIKVRSLKNNFDALPYHPVEIIEQAVPEKERKIIMDGCSADYASRLFRSGRAVLIIDGMDECELPVATDSSSAVPTANSELDKLMEWMNALCLHYPELRIIATSRPIKKRFDSLTAKLTEDTRFYEYLVLPLSPDEQPHLVRNWYAALESSLAAKSNPPAHQNPSGDEESLIKKLSEKNGRLNHYCQTPLLLSVVCAVHYRGELDTRNLSRLLHNLVDLLIEEWRSVHQAVEGFPTGILAKLGKTELKLLLSRLALEMIRQKILVAEEGMISTIFTKELEKLAKANPDNRDLGKIKAADILMTARDRSGVLIENVPGNYMFVHNEFKDLLAALSIVENNCLDELVHHAAQDKWDYTVVKHVVQNLNGSQETVLLALLLNEYPAYAARIAYECNLLTPTVRRNIAKVVYASGKASQSDARFAALYLALGNECGPEADCFFEVNMRVFGKDKVHPVQFGHPKSQNSTLSDPVSVAAFATAIGHLCHDPTEQEFLIEGEWPDREAMLTYLNKQEENALGNASGLKGSEIQIQYSHVLLAWLSMSLPLAMDPARVKHRTSNSPEERRANQLEVIIMVVTNRGALGSCFDGRLFPDIKCYLHGLKLYIEKLPHHPHMGLLAYYIFGDYVVEQGKYERGDGGQPIPFLGSDLLHLFELFPSNAFPAVQIGLLKNLVAKLRLQMSEDSMKKAEALWRQRVEAVEFQASMYIEANFESFGIIKDGKLGPASKAELINNFKSEFRTELAKQEPFSSGVDTAKDAQPV